MKSGWDLFRPKIIWSLTIGPQFIGPSGQMVPNQFSPHGQMVHKKSVPMDKWSPTNLVLPDKWSLEYSVCPGGQAVGIQKKGDHIGWGPFIHGGPNFWGPFFHDDWIWWGLFVKGTLYWILISIVIWAISVKITNLLKTGTKDFSDVKLDKKNLKSYVCY